MLKKNPLYFSLCCFFFSLFSPSFPLSVRAFSARDGNFAPTRPASPRTTPPRTGGGAGTGQDFCLDHRGRAVMGIGTDPSRLARPAPTFNNITKILILIIM